MKIWYIFSFFVAVSSVMARDGDIDLSQLRKNIPGYLPRHTMEGLIEAVGARFYEDKASSAATAAKFMENPALIDRVSDTRNEEAPTCSDLIRRGITDYYLGKNYAQKIADAQGRQESGLLRGNYLWLGNYYECNAATDGKDTVGGMCVSIFGNKPNSTNGVYIGICVPDICTGPEVSALLQPTQPNDTYVTTFCPRDEDFDALDITAIVIFSLLASMVVAGTIYEIITKARVGSNMRSVPGRLLLSFSVIKNTRTLFNTTRKEGNISVLDGMRFFSMGWVILGHSIALSVGAIDNVTDVAQHYITHGSNLILINGTLSVDSFFFLSGLLVAYLSLREMRKRGGKLNVPLMYLQRYLRLTPTLALVMLFTVSLFFQIGEGPIFNLRSDQMLPPCQKYWWTNLLYINNLYPANIGQQCIGWVWYLANDMQFFLLSPIFILLLYRHAPSGIATLGFFIVGSAAITGALATHYEMWPDSLFYGLLSRAVIFFSAPPSNAEASPAGNSVFEMATETTTPSPQTVEDSYWNDIYAKPWCRIGVYLIGMLTGYILYITNRKIKMNKAFVVLMWLTVAAIELSVIYGMWGNVRDFEMPTQNVMSFYIAVMRPVWGFGLMWVTIACASGYGGYINTFLSWKVFIPLGRLTFCAYLIHPLIMQYVYTSREIELHLRLNIVIYYYLANMVLAYSAAYLLSMLIEAPVAEMQKVIFPTRKPESKEKNGLVKNIEVNVVSPIENGYVASISNGKMGIGNHIELEEDVITEKGEYL